MLISSYMSAHGYNAEATGQGNFKLHGFSRVSQRASLTTDNRTRYLPLPISHILCTEKVGMMMTGS